MAIYTYTGQNISDTHNLRAELEGAGEGIAIYTVQGGNVSVEASSITESQCDAAVTAAND